MISEFQSQFREREHISYFDWHRTTYQQKGNIFVFHYHTSITWTRSLCSEYGTAGTQRSLGGGGIDWLGHARVWDLVDGTEGGGESIVWMKQWGAVVREWVGGVMNEVLNDYEWMEKEGKMEGRVECGKGRGISIEVDGNMWEGSVGDRRTRDVWVGSYRNVGIKDNVRN